MGLPASYNQMFMDWVSSQGQAYNDARDKYGVTVATVADQTQAHWRVVGVHHPTIPEGGGNNIYFDILDEAGQRIRGAWAESKNANGATEQVQIHKAWPDHGADFVLWGNDTKSVYVIQEGLPSDRVDNLHTRQSSSMVSIFRWANGMVRGIT